MATQMPLPDTQEDLWRLLYDRSSKTVIMLNELDTADKVSARSRSNRQFQLFISFTNFIAINVYNVATCIVMLLCRLANHIGQNKLVLQGSLVTLRWP